MQRSVCAGTTVGVGRRANGQTGLEGEDEEDGDDGEGECAEVADGGCEALGYGQLEVGGEGGDAMGGVEEGRGEQDDEEQLGDGVAEEGEDVVVDDGVGQPSEGASDVVGEDEGGQCEGGDGAADAEEGPPHRFQLLHSCPPGYKPRKARMMMTETTVQAANPPAAMATCGIRMPNTNSGMALGTSIRTQVAEWRSAPRRKRM